MSNLTHTLADGTVIEVSEPNWDLTYGFHSFDFVTKSGGEIIAQYECEVDVYINRYNVPENANTVMNGRNGRLPVPAYLSEAVNIAAELAISHAWGFVPQMEAAE